MHTLCLFLAFRPLPLPTLHLGCTWRRTPRASMALTVDGLTLLRVSSVAGLLGSFHWYAAIQPSRRAADDPRARPALQACVRCSWTAGESAGPPACTFMHTSLLVLPASSVRPGACAGARRQRVVQAADGRLLACGAHSARWACCWDSLGRWRGSQEP